MPVASQDLAIAYRVEVSGWDSHQEFFVERTELQWSEDGKQVMLSREVSPGALLFLRLLDPTSLDRVHPVPYQASPLAPAAGGQHLVRLIQAWPRQ
jgi:hypothetical protein